ncbi:DNA topoisomerase IB [Leucobacter sp. NPDC058333]|uniref:DNA topoisomerase IB n=1 Tax=Leucobacter sp. NPDC058333 TaxID=3346450 RepID=UPI00365FEFA9
MSAASGRGRRGGPITRHRIDDEFVYRRDGRRLTAAKEIARIEALVIPPAWTDVQIARSPAAKVLARGIDAAGRTQMIYHPRFRQRREREKFARLGRFGTALPKLRARVDRDLRRRRLSRERVVACVIRLIDLEFFRVGNAEYAAQHGSYGVTTLREEHIEATGRSVRFDFVGKSGKRHERRVADPRIARLITRLEALPGDEVFRFFEDTGVSRRVSSKHVNAYVKRVMGEEFTAKDFRTWGGSRLALSSLLEHDEEAFRTETSAAAAARDAVRDAATRLGNTPAVTRSSYIDPRVLALAEDADARARLRKARTKMRPRAHLSVDEQCLLTLLATRGRR